MLEKSVEGVLNTALMLRATQPGPVLLVEGASDKRVLERFTAPGTQYVVGYGKPLVQEAMTRLITNGGRGFLGIVDADHDRLLGFPISPGTITWDRTDLETTLVCTSALDRLVAHICSETKVRAFVAASGKPTLADALLRATVGLGALRFVSRRDEAALPFGKVNILRHVDRRTLVIDARSVAAAALSERSGSQADLDELLAAAQSASLDVVDPTALVNGHDVMTALALGLRRVLASHGNDAPGRQMVEGALFAAFDLPDFQRTSIFAALVDWQEQNPEFELLSRSE